MENLKIKYIDRNSNFVSFYNDYISINTDKTNTLKVFLDSIELNKNYFRTGLKTNRKVLQNKESDTYTIQLLNNNLNKISNINKDNIIADIIKECSIKKHLYSYFFDTILKKTLSHSNYIECYAIIINELVDVSTKEILMKSIELIKKEININQSSKFNNTDTYDNFCDMNLYTEKLYGLNLLLVKLEKMGVLENYVEKNLDELFNILQNTDNDNIIYRVLCCLEQMNTEIDNLINESYRNKLKILVDSSKPKNKFKIIDILDKYN